MIDRITTGHIVIYDLEWTSWPGFQESKWRQPGRHCEIIQIGAVKLDVEDGYRELDAFDAYVKPRINPELSGYITDLTGITQHDVDTHGRAFPEVLADFVAFVGTDFEALFSFGSDGHYMRINCELNGIPLPPVFECEQNLNKALIGLGVIDKGFASSEVPGHLGLENVEISHNALGDVRALAASLRHLRSEGHL